VPIIIIYYVVSIHEGELYLFIYIIIVVFVSVAECRIRGALMFELHAVMAEDARRSQHDTNAVMEALLVSFRAGSGLCCSCGL